ncbi:MAG: DNA-directed RNA polymerase subunit B [Candidatus Woesearchaeota archaeon]
MADIVLNGKYVGAVQDAQDFITRFVDSRRRGSVSKNSNVSYDQEKDIIMIESGRGRLRRPLVVVKDGKSTLTKKHVEQLQKKEIAWDDLVAQGIIEYVDAGEEENALVAFTESDITPNTTHLEIMPLDMFGICASLVPFGNHTAPARLSIGAKNQKQAVGQYIANFGLRIDTDVNLLLNPQKPLVKTIMHDIVDYDSHPSGQNLTVAIIGHKGYNMEDAVIINQSSIERGLARNMYFKPYEAEEIRYSGGLIDAISVPDKEVKGYKSEHDYRLLEDDGIIYPESEITEGDVLIGRVSPPRFLSGMDEYNLISSVQRESSISSSTTGKIDFVMLTENEEGNRTVSIRIRDLRLAEIGDKFTSRHGQKGVVGVLVKQADMPFTGSGVVPDLLFSPNGIPSRMTISHLLELIGAKVSALNGRYVDGTTFNCEPEEMLREELKQAGFRENGTETMYDGATGEMFEAKIYVGSMYYLKLKHMVKNRLQSRARGPIQLLTRQPTEGRAKEGGLRLGEMEKDTFVAHGASLLLKERFDADKTIVPVDETSGLMVWKDVYKNRYVSPVGGESSDIANVEVAYAFKLLIDEFKSMCLYPKLTLKSKY